VLGVGGRDCLLDGKVDRAAEEQRRLSDSLGAMDCSLVVVVEVEDSELVRERVSE